MSERPTFSRVRGGIRIGRDFFERRGLRTEIDSPPHGVVDSMSALAHPGLDPESVHPLVQVFFTQTDSLSLFIRSAWRFPFSLAWLVGRPILRRIGQFALPAKQATIETRVHGLDASKDGRSDVRAVIRTYVDCDITMQAVAYATWTSGKKRFMSAAFPLPFCQLTGILRLDHAKDGEGVTLTSDREDGDDAGVYLCVGSFAFRTPFGERFSLWPASSSAATEAAKERANTTIVGVHEQFFWGMRVVTHHYWFGPRTE